MNEHRIKQADIKAAVEEIYNKYKDMQPDGTVDPRLTDVDAGKFGIAVMLTDGTLIEAGDTDTASPLGSIAKVPLMTAMRIQRENKADKTQDKRCALKDYHSSKPERMPVSVNGIRLMSAIEPANDADGKWNIVINLVNAMTGTPLVLDDKLYESMTLTNRAADVENAMAANEFYLFDDAPIAIDLYTRLTAMQATARQLAAMGATLAASGKNPATGDYVFDRAVSPKVVASMAAKGPHKMSLHWLIKSGLPAKSSFGGSVMGVFPGVMSVVAYSPVVNDDGVSIKAAKAVHHIMKRLGINVFGGENIVIEK